MKRLVLASNNVGKLREFSQLLAPLDVEVIPQSALGIPEAEEPHASFVENALAKARHASRASGLPAMADDSGLCVDALAGAPGVLSARYGGEPKSDARNNEKLLAALNALNASKIPGASGAAASPSEKQNRHARFVCVLVLVRHADDPQPLIAEGEWHGQILETTRGESGFGYDPLFLVDGTAQTAAELPAERKNQISHRGQAMAQLLKRLEQTKALHPPLA